MNIGNNTHYSDSESSSKTKFFNSLACNEEIQNLTEKNKNKFFSHNAKNKKIGEIEEIKNLPTYFFILFLIVLCVLLFKFAPCFYKFSTENTKLEDYVNQKNKLKYFSSFLSKLDIFSKVIK